MRNCCACRSRTQNRSSAAIAACTATTTNSMCSTGGRVRASSTCGSQCGASIRAGRSARSTCQSTNAITATLASDFAASTRLSGPSRRRSPARGLMRLKSGCSAVPLIRKPVCSSEAAVPASSAARTNGAAPRSSGRCGQPQCAGPRQAGRIGVGEKRHEARGQTLRRIAGGHGHHQRHRRQAGEVVDFPRDRHVAFLARALQPPWGGGFRAVLLRRVLRHGESVAGQRGQAVTHGVLPGREDDAEQTCQQHQAADDLARHGDEIDL